MESKDSSMESLKLDGSKGQFIDVQDTSLSPMIYDKSTEVTKIETQDDLEYVKGNLREIIETSKDVIKTLHQLSEDSGHPKLFDSLNQLLKTASEVNKNYSDIIGVKKQVTEDKVVNNTMFVGSTKELLDFMNGKKT